MPGRARVNGGRYVLVVVPAMVGGTAGGGIARVMQYLADAWTAQRLSPPLRLVASRGAGHIVVSPLHLLRCLFVMLVDGLRGRIALVHLSVASRGSTWRKLVVGAAAGAFGLPLLVHLHGGLYREFFAGLGPFGKRLVRWLFARADRVVVLGEDWKRFVQQEIGVPAERVDILHNAVPDPLDGGEMPPHRHDGPVRILFLGRLGQVKGVPELLQAFAFERLRELSWQAVLAGDGDAGRYRADAKSAGLADRIDFPGWLDSATAARLCREFDIFVLPSRVEGLSVALLEAMANGMAVIATPVGAHGEIVKSGENGVLVPVGDVPALAGALAALISDPSLRGQLGQAARRSYLEGLTVESSAIRLQRIYADCGLPEAVSSR